MELNGLFSATSATELPSDCFTFHGTSRPASKLPLPSNSWPRRDQELVRIKIAANARFFRQAGSGFCTNAAFRAKLRLSIDYKLLDRYRAALAGPKEVPDRF